MVSIRIGHQHNSIDAAYAGDVSHYSDTAIIMPPSSLCSFPRVVAFRYRHCVTMDCKSFDLDQPLLADGLAEGGRLRGDGEACAGVELEVGVAAGVDGAQLIGDRTQIKVAV
jgi:hypothetical protein